MSDPERLARIRAHLDEARRALQRGDHATVLLRILDALETLTDEVDPLSRAGWRQGARSDRP